MRRQPGRVPRPGVASIAGSRETVQVQSTQFERARRLPSDLPWLAE